MAVDGHGHVLQAFGALCCGDDDFFQCAGLCHGRCARNREDDGCRQRFYDVDGWATCIVGSWRRITLLDQFVHGHYDGQAAVSTVRADRTGVLMRSSIHGRVIHVVVVMARMVT